MCAYEWADDRRRLKMDDVFDEELKALHDVEGRFHHVWAHPVSMLEMASRHAGEIASPRAVGRVIRTHDVVYDSLRNDNEERSAQFAAKLYAETSDADEMAFILAGIRSTAGHVVPEDLPAAWRRDIGVVLDLDLAILGADEEVFDQYDRNIRLEYAWATDEQWRVGRAAVMRGFLQRPAIFVTPSFRDEFESRARRNIGRLLASLEA